MFPFCLYICLFFIYLFTIMSASTTCPASSAQKTKDACPFMLVDQEPENVSLVSAVEDW